jgi:hypothetical protein
MVPYGKKKEKKQARNRPFTVVRLVAEIILSYIILISVHPGL